MKRVHFIGSGYESEKFILVVAETNREAFDKAEKWYKSTGQTFHYCEMEVDKFESDMENNTGDRVFICPKCGNKALVPVEENPNAIGVDWHDLCICEECAAELYAEPQFDCTIKFVELEEE